MTWFTENPIPPVVLGIVVEALLALGLAKTGRRAFLWGMLATAALAATAVVAERLIVTPREEVTASLEEMRGIVAANDRAALLERIDKNFVRLRNQVQTDLSQLTITEAKINDLKVAVDPGGTVARADFIGVVRFKAGTPIPYDHVTLRFDVELRKRAEDGRWLVTSADYRSPLKPND